MEKTKRNTFKSYTENGFTVLETQSEDGQYTIFKYNDHYITFIHNGEVLYDGEYDKDEWEEMNEKMSQKLKEFNAETERRINEFDKEFERIFGAAIDNSRPFYLNDHLPPTSYYYDSTSYNDNVYHRKKRRHKKNNTAGCFGCLVWSVIIFIVFCLVFYCMGALGEVIIDFFQKIF